MARTRSGQAYRDEASPLLVPLLEWPDLLGEVLARLDPTDRAMLAHVGRPWLAAVEASGRGLHSFTLELNLSISRTHS
jgi:hypothetical protein